MQVERTFAVLVIISSCTVAFAQGANDVANAIGPLAGVVEIVKTNAVPGRVPVSMWFLVLGGLGIAIGMMTVLTCSKMGLPVSTTHTMIGAILGVGLARGITAINRKVVGSIFTSWIGTVPAAAVLTVLFYLIAKLLLW